MKNKVSKIDNNNFITLRKNIDTFIYNLQKKYDKEGLVMLDVAPQDHEGARKYFKKTVIETLDIDPGSDADYIADLCQTNSAIIPDNHFDMVLLSEVLEHTLQPFDAVNEVHRILKPCGYLFITVPFNFRIHGPLPDCWRFTEHGIRSLLKNYEIEQIEAKEDEDRFLMPIGYTVIAKRTCK